MPAVDFLDRSAILKTARLTTSRKSANWHVPIRGGLIWSQISLGFVCFVFGCSEAKFVGLPAVAAIGNLSAVTGHPEPACQFTNHVHPGVDDLMFDISVSGADVRLNGGASNVWPTNTGAGFGYLGAVLPVASDGNVRAVVTQNGLSGSCDQIVLPLDFATSPLTRISGNESGGAVSFHWIWKNLYSEEQIYFDAGGTVVSTDLTDLTDLIGMGPDCVATPPKPDPKGDLFSQEFTCTVKYRSNSTIKSVRYKDQKFSWRLSRVGVADKNVVRGITIDLIRNSFSLPVGDAVTDPDTCMVIVGMTGFRFSHICEGRQSGLGSPSECRLVGGLSGPCGG